MGQEKRLFPVVKKHVAYAIILGLVLCISAVLGYLLLLSNSKYDVVIKRGLSQDKTRLDLSLETIF